MAGEIDTGAEAAPDAGAAPDIDDNAVLLAELEAEERAQAAPAAAAKAKPAPRAAEADDSDDAPGADADLDDDEEAAVAGDDDDDLDDLDDADDEAEGDAADPEQAKRIAAVRRADERRRKSFERERAAFEREREAWQAQTKQVGEAQKRFERLSARFRYDPVAVARELGATDEDFELIAQNFAAHSKAPGITPAHRAAAERAMREREIADKADAANKRADELEAKLAERDQRAEADRVVNAFMGKVTRLAAAATDAPLTAALAEKNPARARAELEQTAYRIAKKTGAMPKPAMVIAAHERRLSRALRDLGIDAPTPAAAKPGERAPAPAPAKPSPSARPTAKPAKAPTRAAAEPGRTNGVVHIPSRDDLLRELQSASADDLS